MREIRVRMEPPDDAPAADDTFGQPAEMRVRSWVKE
jgi:hypothetical protein